MSERTRTYLKVGGLVVGLLGLLAGLANLLGFFSHPNRETMVDMIRSKGEIPATAPGFPELLRAFPPPEGVRTEHIAGIGPTTHLSSGGYVTPTGPLAYFNGNEERGYTRPILTFDELEGWAASSGYPWLAWIISAAGWMVLAVGIAGDLASARATDNGAV